VSKAKVFDSGTGKVRPNVTYCTVHYLILGTSPRDVHTSGPKQITTLLVQYLNRTNIVKHTREDHLHCPKGRENNTGPSRSCRHAELTPDFLQTFPRQFPRIERTRSPALSTTTRMVMPQFPFPSSLSPQARRIIRPGGPQRSTHLAPYVVWMRSHRVARRNGIYGRARNASRSPL
jgi:hypothetical protein